MILSDIATVKTGFKNADFWIERRGGVDTVGKVSREYNAERIGVKIVKTETANPDYLYYCLMNMHSLGEWKQRCYGTLQLQHIRVSDVKSIRLIAR